MWCLNVKGSRRRSGIKWQEELNQSSTGMQDLPVRAAENHLFINLTLRTRLMWTWPCMSERGKEAPMNHGKEKKERARETMTDNLEQSEALAAADLAESSQKGPGGRAFKEQVNRVQCPRSRQILWQPVLSRCKPPGCGDPPTLSTQVCRHSKEHLGWKHASHSWLSIPFMTFASCFRV